MNLKRRAPWHVTSVVLEDSGSINLTMKIAAACLVMMEESMKIKDAENKRNNRKF